MNQGAADLIGELLANPASFNEEGRAFELLQRYFKGASLETLRPLLESDDVFVQKSAAFILSELGARAEILIDDIPPLLRSPDLQVVWDAMEALAVCSIGPRSKEFANVISMLTCSSVPLRQLAMYLMANVDGSVLEACGDHFRASGSAGQTHADGLRMLTDAETSSRIVRSFLEHEGALQRLYGAIGARRLGGRSPELVTAAESSDDSDVRSLFERAELNRRMTSSSCETAAPPGSRRCST